MTAATLPEPNGTKVVDSPGDQPGTAIQSLQVMRSLLAVVVLLATAACDGSPPAPTPPPAVTPQPDTAAAPVARIAVAVDDLGSRDAIVLLSEVAVDAKASTGSGDLTYAIDFGDGTTTTDAVARHVYEAPGTFTITCLVRDPAGRTATASREIVVTTLTGRWFHAGYVPHARRFELRSLTITDQEGLGVRGFYGLTSTPDRPFTGRLESPRTVHIVIDDQTVQLDGVVPGSLNEDSLPWTLLMRGGAVDGERLAFRPVLGEPSGPPPDAVFRIRFDSFGAALPILGLSPIQFDGSTSRGDALSYVIEFGDGEVSTQPTATHRIDTNFGCLLSGLVTARMTVVDRFGRTDAEIKSFQPFEVGGCGADGWVFAEGNNNTNFSFRRFEFRGRQGLNLTGSLIWRDPGSTDGTTTPFTARLSGERDIRIVLQGAGIEFRGHIELRSYCCDFRMILTQTGGPDHGRVWTLPWDDGPG